MGDIDVEQARRILGNLRDTLTKITSRDPEQEVRGFAIPVLDAVLTAIRALMPNDPIVQTARDVVSPETIEQGEPVRAVEVLIVVETLLGALPPRKMPRARFLSPDI